MYGMAHLMHMIHTSSQDRVMLHRPRARSPNHCIRGATAAACMVATVVQECHYCRVGLGVERPKYRAARVSLSRRHCQIAQSTLYTRLSAFTHPPFALRSLAPFFLFSRPA